MTNLEIIRHNDILFRDLLRAVAVKNVAWPHPVESQVKWIIDNMQSNDMHVFLKEDGEDKAYMTLSPVTATVNGVETPFMGVGCVCAAHPGTGGGKLLVENVNKYLKEYNLKGLLFCKENLIKFYCKFNWELLPQERACLPVCSSDIFTMVYNTPLIESLKYQGHLF